jgi:hypothetical protein
MVAIQHIARGGRLIIAMLIAVHAGQKPAKIGIALHVLAKQREMITAFQLYLRPDYGFNAGFPGKVIESDCAGEAVMVGKRQGRHIEMPGFIYKSGRAGSPVKEAVIGMYMKMDKRHEKCLNKSVEQAA